MVKENEGYPPPPHPELTEREYERWIDDVMGASTREYVEEQLLITENEEVLREPEVFRLITYLV